MVVVYSMFRIHRRVSDLADVGDEKLDMESHEPLKLIFAFGCAKKAGERSSNVP